MKPLTANDIRGVWATVLLPLNEDGTISWARLAAELDVLLTSGVNGVYAHGTAGEFHTLDDAEYGAVNHMLAERCEAASMPFQIGASHPAAPVMLGRIRRAADLAPGAIQVILPDWVPLRDDEVVRFMVGASEAAGGVPLVLYNPPHAKTHVPPALLATLTQEVAGLAGLKSGGGNDQWFAEMRQLADRLSNFVPGHLLASGFRRGAHGSYSNIAALSPQGAADWFTTITDDLGAGLDVERRIGEFFGLHIAPLQARMFSNPALDKFLAVVGGWADIGLDTRWPTMPVLGSSVMPARAGAHRLLPELFPDAAI